VARKEYHEPSVAAREEYHQPATGWWQRRQPHVASSGRSGVTWGARSVIAMGWSKAARKIGKNKGRRRSRTEWGGWEEYHKPANEWWRKRWSQVAGTGKSGVTQGSKSVIADGWDKNQKM
jgi:hypothetical protein